jgi:hypothetical protein
MGADHLHQSYQTSAGISEQREDFVVKEYDSNNPP